MHGEKRLSSSAADIIDDLLLEILVNLPAKSLLRFQVVSKHWCSLISDESFRRRHHRRNRQVSFILCRSQQNLICDLSEKTLVPLQLDWTSNLNILQSSNGLLLLDSWLDSGRKSERKIYVYNPTTQHKRPRMIAHLEWTEIFYDDSQLFLVYNPSESPYYRVFMVYELDGSRFRVYHSRTHKWEDHDYQNPLMNRFRVYSSGVTAVWNDRLYLFGNLIENREDLLCLSPKDDDQIVMSAIPLPGLPHISSDSCKRYTMESNGHLHYIVLSSQWMGKLMCFVKVFEMTDHTTWVHLGRFSAILYVESRATTEVLGLVRGEREEDDSTLVYQVPGKIMSYRFRDKVSEEIVDFSRNVDILRHDKNWMDSLSFIHTLVPLV